MTESISFANRVAIVTGGARGLGAAYAHELARRGCAVVIHDSGVAPDGSRPDPEPAQQLAQSIIDRGGAAVVCTTDASTRDGGCAAIDVAISAFGKLDIVIANAGIIAHSPFADWSTDDFESQLRQAITYWRRFMSCSPPSRS